MNSSGVLLEKGAPKLLKSGEYTVVCSYVKLQKLSWKKTKSINIHFTKVFKSILDSIVDPVLLCSFNGGSAKFFQLFPLVLQIVI